VKRPQKNLTKSEKVVLRTCRKALSNKRAMKLLDKKMDTDVEWRRIVRDIALGLTTQPYGRPPGQATNAALAKWVMQGHVDHARWQKIKNPVAIGIGRAREILWEGDIRYTEQQLRNLRRRGKPKKAAKDAS
jgi:hypothetical protein